MSGRLSKLATPLALAVVTAAAIYAASGTTPFLRARFAAQEWLVAYTRVVTLKVEKTPGLKMFLDVDDPVITPQIMATGIWEANETKFIVRALHEGDTFVDLGANVGYYTLLASHLVGESGRVFAFEPNPVAFALMERNVRLNGLTNVVLEQKAVSDKPGTLQLFLSEKNKGDHRIYRTEDDRLAIDVPATTLDSYFADIDGSIDFVKIDTQGAEGAILNGMRGILAENPELSLAFEFWPYGLNGMGHDARDLLDLLQEHDYMFFDMGPGGTQVHETLSLVRADNLLKRFTIEKHGFTNLLAVKGAAEMLRLGWAALRMRRVFDAAALVADQQRPAWEVAQRRALETGALAAAELPEKVRTSLVLPSEERTDDQEAAVATYFRETAPVLAAARAALGEALAATDAHRDRALARAFSDDHTKKP